MDISREGLRVGFLLFYSFARNLQKHHNSEDGCAALHCARFSLNHCGREGCGHGPLQCRPQSSASGHAIMWRGPGVHRQSGSARLPAHTTRGHLVRHGLRLSCVKLQCNFNILVSEWVYERKIYIWTVFWVCLIQLWKCSDIICIKYSVRFLWRVLNSML